MSSNETLSAEVVEMPSTSIAKNADDTVDRKQVASDAESPVDEKAGKPVDGGKGSVSDSKRKPTLGAAKTRSVAKKKPAKAESLEDVKAVHKTSVSDEVVIRFDHVTKTYKLYKNDRGRFLGIFNYEKKGAFLGRVDAAKDVSFEIKKGEAVSFIGRNGAGKSTTLKMVTGVTHPTSGGVTVNGHVSALLELSAGFDMQLTGRENIALRGQIRGLTKARVKELEPSIIEFAELGVYIDQPMRTYSSGMKARLGFAFAVAMQPDILVVDEALSVGDKVFKKKCIKRIREIMMDENVTVLFVTHSSSIAQEFCSRGIVLDKGQLLYDGPIEDAIAYYDKLY